MKKRKKVGTKVKSTKKGKNFEERVRWKDTRNMQKGIKESGGLQIRNRIGGVKWREEERKGKELRGEERRKNKRR